MHWKRILPIASLAFAVLFLLPRPSRGDAEAWRIDGRRPDARSAGDMPSHVEAWRVDARRPADLPEGGGADRVQAWHDDTRRPSGNPEGDMGLGRVEAWRVDVRRPSAWPKGAPEAPQVAQVDTDGDGVLDGEDQCPDTPRGATVDARGCPMDSDGDGVYDGIDQCPGTPRGSTVDARGCPMDSDGDGVYDGIDQCPDTPHGAKVDAKGCPISAKEAELLDTGKLRLRNVFFDTNKATLKPESYAALDETGGILEKWPQLRIEVGGHTDSQGADAYNMDLSRRRAQAVLDYLTGKFKIEAGQYTAKGYGESNPVASNDTAEGRAQNRRVELNVLNKEVLKKQ